MVNVQVEKRVDVSTRQQTALVVVAARLQTPPGMWIVIWIQDFVPMKTGFSLARFRNSICIPGVHSPLHTKMIIIASCKEEIRRERNSSASW